MSPQPSAPEGGSATEIGCDCAETDRTDRSPDEIAVDVTWLLLFVIGHAIVMDSGQTVYGQA
jgi:hypothetical protein